MNRETILLHVASWANALESMIDLRNEPILSKDFQESLGEEIKRLNRLIQEAKGEL